MHVVTGRFSWHLGTFLPLLIHIKKYFCLSGGNVLQRYRTCVLHIINPMLLTYLDVRISLKRTPVAAFPGSGTEVVQNV